MKILSFILFIVFLEACNQSIAEEVVYDDKRIWKLEWALINSLLLEDSIRARLFFDTLVSSKKPIGELFLLEGLSLYPSSDSSKSIQILCNQPDSIVALLCRNLDFFKNKSCCRLVIDELIWDERVLFPDLRKSILEMYILDQAYRGNILNELALGLDYKIPKSLIDVDAINQARLKMVIKSYGFPTKSMIGSDGLHAVWLLIQHSDSDLQFQKDMLPCLYDLANKNSNDKSDYAYLDDRVRISSGQKQLYGTQVQLADKVRNIFVLKPTMDSLNLENRRMLMGLPPIEVYRTIFFSGL